MFHLEPECCLLFRALPSGTLACLRILQIVCPQRQPIAHAIGACTLVRVQLATHAKDIIVNASTVVVHVLRTKKDTGCRASKLVLR